MLNVNRYENTIKELYGERASKRKADIEALASEFEDRYGGQTSEEIGRAHV